MPIETVLRPDVCWRVLDVPSRLRRAALFAVACSAALRLSAQAPWIVWPPSAESCKPTSGDATAVLERAWTAMGASDSIVELTTSEIVSHNYESDRTYRPFISFTTAHSTRLDPTTGVTRDSADDVQITDDHTTFVRSDSAWKESGPAWAAADRFRALDPRIVVRAWRSARAVKVVARCRYRDYDRLVLTRTGSYGPEKLYVDPKSGLPIKLDRVEPHYLWGQTHVEYVYATWWIYGGVLTPTAATRLVDGDEEVSRTIGGARRIAADSGAPIALPGEPTSTEVTTPIFMRPAPLDTVRLGAQSFILANRGFNEVVTLQRDTVWVLDATQGEERARADSAWIARLFPGRHPVRVVITDLAWPHVAGVRFWVASGATIVSNERSRRFLEAVVARKWTLHPDKLARSGKRTLSFVAAGDSLVRPGIRTYPIDGVGSEGALMVYLPSDSVLWASDYVQQLKRPAQYTNEVLAATCRVGIVPERVVAEHQKLTPWSTLTALVPGGCSGSPADG
jgi:hypothetical protein